MSTSGVRKVIVGNRKLAPAEVLQIACQGAVVELDTAVLEKVTGGRGGRLFAPSTTWQTTKTTTRQLCALASRRPARCVHLSMSLWQPACVLNNYRYFLVFCIWGWA